MTGRILVFGDVIDDIVVVPEGPVRPDTDTNAIIRPHPGGSAANVASWLAAQDAAVDFVGRVGALDVERHSAVLRAAGVTPHLHTDDELPTGTIVILVEGNSRAMLTDAGANVNFSADHVSDELLAEADLVHFTAYSIRGDSDAIGRLIGRARAAGVTVSVDPASAGFLTDVGVDRFFDIVEGCGIIMPNRDEGRVLTGLERPDDIARELATRFPVVAFTLGDEGAIVCERGGEPVRVEPVRAELVDPTGAGDAFSAGFLAAWLRNRDAVAAAEAGVRTAARAVAKLGARP